MCQFAKRAPPLFRPAMDSDLRPSRHVAPQGAERALSDELLGAFTSLMPDAAVVVDASGSIVSANEQADTLFGYPPGTLVGLPIETLVPERRRHRHRQHRSDYFAGPQRRPMGAGLELTGRRRDGREFPVDISLAPITSGERLVVAAVRDMTEMRAATAAQAELAAIVSSSLDAIISTTLEGHVTSWNPAAEDLLGYSRDEIVGEHIALLVPDDSSVVLEELLDVVSQGSHLGASDTRWRHRDGHEVDVAVVISPLKDEAGTLLGYSSVVRDIRERKDAERALRCLLEDEERLERQHAATSEIRLALLSGRPMRESLTLICERAAELLVAPVVVISMTEGDSVRISAAVGPASGMVGMSLPARSSFVETVMASGQHQQLAHRTDGSSVDVPGDLPDGPTLGMPIVVGGRARGALTVVRSENVPEFSSGDLFVAEALAAQAALAFEIERARQDREQMMLVGDRERIARDLHDHVIQQLFATGIWLQAVLPFIESSHASGRVSDAIDSLDDTIRGIRNTIYDLSRPQSAAEHLTEQVLEVAQVAGGTLGYSPSVHFEGLVNDGIPEKVVLHLLAVVREALSNTARHAQARNAQVYVALQDGSLRVTVIDDGVGIGDTTRSSGLANLAERARILGGSFDVSAPPDGGTCLDWKVPVDN